MKKFPVISENGNEYEVIIRRYSYSEAYGVSVYKRFKLLGIPFRTIQNYQLLGVQHYSAIEYDYDFVKMAQDEVYRMEAEWAEDSRRESMLEHGITKFEEWDGNCSDK